jgi:4-hydroxy-4-methyl-2-oxoglutarate aldolase
MSDIRLTGRIAAERVRLYAVPRAPGDVIAALKAIDVPTELVSDALDDLGIDGVLSASIVKPTIPGSMIVGPALTLRNIPLPQSPHATIIANHLNRQADFEAHNLTQPGDVLVVEGGRYVSNMGGISATMAKRQGSPGTIIWGGIRDVRHSRSIGHPIWSTDVTAKTGRWRQETIEINGPVNIGGITVYPGDIVCADDSAVCFIPRIHAEEVVRRVLLRLETDEDSMRFLAEGRAITDFPKPDPAAFRE